MGFQKYTSDVMREMIRKRFEDKREFVVVEEVGDNTGGAMTRRLDVVVVNAFCSKGQYLEGIEIKVSREDLFSELRDPQKHTVFYRNLEKFSLCCPAELLTKDILAMMPPKWGLYVPNGNGSIRVRKSATPLHDEPPTTVDRGFMVSLLRTMSSRSTIADQIKKSHAEGVELGQSFAELEWKKKVDAAVKASGVEDAFLGKKFLEAAGMSFF